jgi:hypothetical protein
MVAWRLPFSGLWRSLVAHLVRIEGVRGSNPLSSTKVGTLEPLLKRSPCRSAVVAWRRGLDESWVEVRVQSPHIFGRHLRWNLRGMSERHS